MCRVGRASALAVALLALAFIPAQHAAAQDAPGDASTTVRFAVPGVLDETITPASDTDVFLVPLVSGGVYQFETRRRGNVVLDTTLGLYPPGHMNFGAITAGTSDCFNASGVLAFNDDTGVGVSQITWTATQTGDHLLCVDTFGTGNSMGGYRLTATVTTPPPVPNLAATSATFAGSPPTVNETGATVTLLTPRQSGLTLDVAVANAGDASTNAMIQVYRAPNARDAGSPPTAPGCGGANVLCRAGQPRTVGAFASGGATPQTSSTFIASGTDGLYHYFACFTDAAETATLTDNCTPSIPARVGGADLSVTVAVDRNLTVSSGATTPATASITNNGAAFFRFEGGLTVNFYRSGPLAGTDPVPGLPTPLGSSVGMFTTGASFNVNAAAATEPAADTLIPSTPGTYYYFACATSAALPAAICSEASPSVTVTIAGAITFGGDLTGEVTEDDADMNMATGTLTVTNPGSGGTDVVVQDAADGIYGLFSVGADGRWDYTLGGNTANDNAVNALAAGIEMDDTFTITAVAGGTVDVTITVTGANDAPTAVITAPIDGAQVDFGSTVTLTGSTSSDPDSGQTATLTYQWSASPNVGSFADAAAASTTWTAPTSGTDPVVLTLTVTDDGSPGLSDTAEATITPVAVAVTFGGATTGGVTEKFSGTATGTLTLTTAAANKNVIRQTARLGTYGRFSINPNRRWTYTLDDALPATNALARNMKVTDVFTVAAAANPDATVDVVITVTGTNDAPVGILTSPAPGTRVGFGGTLTLDISDSFDPDTGETETLRFRWLSPTTGVADSSASVTTWTAPASGTPGSVFFQYGLLDVHGNDFGGQFIAPGFNVELVDGTFTITGNQEGAVAEDGVQTVTATVTVTNDASGETPAFTARELLGSYGRFSITTGGVWTYTLGGGAGNPGIDTALNALAAGQVELERFYARSTVDALITIMVTGANDAPTAAISAPADGMQVDFGTTVTLTATGEDLDAGATLTYAWTASPNVGSFANAAAEDTTWTAPTSGAAPVTLTLTVTDDTSPPLTGTAQVIVNPTAVAVTFPGSVTTGSVTEDSGTAVGGALTLTTTSSNKNVVVQTGTPGAYGMFSITAPGAWTYTLDNADDDTNALAAGVTVMDTFTVTASANPAATVDVVITITGANDAPTVAISAPTDGMQVDFGSAVTLTATGEDPDTGQTATLTYEWTATPDVGSFANAAAASTTWTVPASGTDPVTLTLTVMDDATTRLSDTAAVTVNPVAVAITFPGGTTGGINEGDTSITRTLTVTSSGSNTNVVAQTAVSGTYGTFAIDANGRWTYTLDNTNSAINPLAAGATLDDPFTVVAEANSDATVVITITITGVNDAPTVEITAPATNGMQVDFNSVVTLTATGTDPDTGQTATLSYQWSASPNVGSFANAAAEDTTWTAPASGTAPVTLTLTATDNASPPLTGTAQVIVNPVATAVTFAGDTTGDVNEGDTTQITGTLTATTRDGATTVVARSSVSGLYGTFSIDANGGWSYTLDNTNPAINPLAEDATLDDPFTVTAEANAGATQVITITITGVNDAPTASIITPAPTLSGTLSFVAGQRVNLVGTQTDVDVGNTFTYAWTVNPNQGTFADSAAATTTYHPPTVTTPTDHTLTLTVTDNDGGSDTATFVLAVTQGPGVGGPGLDDSDSATDDSPQVGTTPDIDDNGVITSGGTASGMLTVARIPTDQTGNPLPVTHSILTQPTYGIASINDNALTRNVGDVWNYLLDNSREVTRNFGPQSANAPAEDTFMVRTTIGPEIEIDSEITVTLTAAAFPDDRPQIIFATGPRMTVDEGEEMVTLDASGSSDPEGGTLMYLWAQNTNDDIQVTLSGTTTDTATFTAPDERTTLNFALTVTDDGTTPDPATDLTATLIVRVGRTSERALQKTLAAFGRAFATGTVSIFEDYLSTPARTNTSHFTIGGHKFDMATTTPSATVGTDRDLSALTTPPSFPNDRKTGSDSDHVFHRIGNPVEPLPTAVGTGRDLSDTINSANLASTTSNGATTSDHATATTTLMSGQDLLMQSAFHLNLNDPTAASPGWIFWGRATTSNFDGKPEDDFDMNGDVTSAYLGTDYRTPAGTRLGIAISETSGEVDYDDTTDEAQGDLEADLTSILPYIQWQPNDTTNAWAMLGYGKGDAELSTDGDDQTTEVDIDMQMIALGVSGDLTTYKRSEWSWKASAFAVELESDENAETDLPAVDASAQRLRAAIQGRVPGQVSATGGVFTPNWELGIRWDDGDAEQGSGADLGLGFNYTNPANGWSMQGKTSFLVAHEAEDYEEWDASLQARLDPGVQGRGVTFTLEPGWSKDGRSQRMGMDFSNALGKWTKRGLRLELIGERTEQDDNNTGHNIRLTGSLHF